MTPFKNTKIFASCILTVIFFFVSSTLCEENKKVSRKIGSKVWRSGSSPLADAQVERLARHVGYRGARLQEGEADESEDSGWFNFNLGEFIFREKGKRSYEGGRNVEIMSMRGDMKFRRNLHDNGLKLLDCIDDRGTGLQATLIVDTRDPMYKKDPSRARVYMIFRGTEPGAKTERKSFWSLPKDVKADIGDIGYEEYAKAKDKLSEWAKKYSGNITVTGHSLGCALGQRFIADNAKHLKRAAFFNAPAVDKETKEKTRKEELFDKNGKAKITYYVSANDPVSEAGGAEHLYGDVYQVDGGKTRTFFSQSDETKYMAEHTGYMLQENSETYVKKITFEAWQERHTYGNTIDRAVTGLLDTTYNWITFNSNKEWVRKLATKDAIPVEKYVHINETMAEMEALIEKGDPTSVQKALDMGYKLKESIPPEKESDYNFILSFDIDNAVDLASRKWLELKEKGIKEVKFPKIENIKATLGDFDGPEFTDSAKLGDVLAFSVKRTGIWTEDFTVEWLMNGITYKKEPADNDKIHILRFDTDTLDTGSYALAVRSIDNESGKIVSHKKVKFRLKGDYPEDLPPFSVKGYTGGYGLSPLSGYVSEGDDLFFKAEVPHPKSDEPLVTNLFWQLYDSKGNPVKKIKKTIPAYESGGKRDYKFSFKNDGFKPGKYTIALTHSLAEDPKISEQATFDFEVHDAVNIKKLIVTDSPDGDRHKNVLKSDRFPHLFVYYDLDDSVYEVKVKFIVRDETDNKLLYETTTKKARKENTVTQRVGMLLDRDIAIIPGGHKASFRAEITSPDNKVKEETIEFLVEDYVVSISMPDKLKSNETGNFRISAPGGFQEPYKLSFDSSKNITIHHKKDALTGKVTPIAARGSPYTAYIYATVTDSSSPAKVGRGKASFTVIPLEVVKKVKVKQKKKKISGEIEWTKEDFSSLGHTAKYQVKKGTRIMHGSYYEYYLSGQMKYYCTYNNNKRIGNCKGYFKDGSISLIESYYEPGILNGQRRVYHKYKDKRYLYIDQRYDMGQMTVHKEYDKDGNLTYHRSFDKTTGKWKKWK